MKAERRHELKINTLDDALAKMHAQWRMYATWGTTSVIVAILAGVLVHNRIVSSQNRAIKAADDMAVVRLELEQIKMQISAGEANQASEYYRDITSRLDSILSAVGSGDPNLAAEALVARGDVDWYMAGAAGATTQPLLDQPSSDELQKDAQAAYQQALSSYPQQHFAANSARLGLAAIAENNHAWTDARTQYQAVIDDPHAAEVTANLAKVRISDLDQLENPPVIGQIPASPITATAPTTRK